MSDRYRDEEEAEFELDEGEPPKRRGRLLAVLIALFAVGGFGGVLWYAYSQGQRSGEGMTPTLKADGEPSRVKPDQPGGMVVPHQDKLVLNNMQQAAKPGQTERLLPPAEAPLPQTTRTVPPPAASVTLAPMPSTAPPPPPPVMTPAPTSAPSAVAPASPSPANSGAALVAPPAPPPVAPAPSSTPAASPSPVPMTPPPPAAPQMAARPPASSATAPPPRAGGGSGSGEWRVQLGSFPAADQATAQWDRLKKSFAELQPLGLTTVRVDLGDKGVWYRLQAGPLNESGARALCEDLKSKKRDCIVVRP